MDKIVQLEKNMYKISVLLNLINSLIEYNNIDGYDNKKNFDVNLSYKKYDNKYYYSMNISRGRALKKDIFTSRFVYDKNITNNILLMIKPLLESDEVLYTAFQRDSLLNDTKYCITFKNGIEFKIDINEEEDLTIFKKLNDEIRKEKVIIEDKKIENIDKDTIQSEKTIKISNIALNIFKSLEEYNNIENYDNVKPYKFMIDKIYDEKNNCYLLYFSVIRGINNTETIFKLKTCTKDENLIYNIIHNFIINYRNNKNFIYESINEKENYFSTTLNNQISIQYNFNNMKDELFYKKIFNKEDIVTLKKTIK